MTIKPLYIEEVMRFIYIVGILLLIAIGFLVYFYRDWLFGTIDGFQAGGSGNVVFQLFEQRCYNTNKYFPTVSKSNALLMCNKLGGRLATYDELKTAVKSGFVIDSDKAAMVIDSDTTYVSNNSVLNQKSTSAASPYSYEYYTNENGDKSSTKGTGIGYDDINLTISAGCTHRYEDFNGSQVRRVEMDNNGVCGNKYYDLDSYVFIKDTNFDTAHYEEHVGGAISSKKYVYHSVVFRRKIAPKESYGHPVCIAATAPPGNTVDVVFPERTGKGWNNDNDTITATNTSIGGTSFTKRYNIRKQGDTTPFNATCPMPSRVAAGSTISLVSSTDPPSVSFNTPAPTTPQTSYNILNMDAIHTQVEIAAIDLPIRRDVVIANEQANISAGTISTTVAHTDVIPIANEGGRRVRNAYASLIKQTLARSTESTNLILDFEETLSPLLSYYEPHGAIMNALQSGAMTPAQFSNMLLKNIDDYYNALSLTIALHPVGFLRKGVMNFSSFLNTFKIYNFPAISSFNFYMVGGLSNQPVWEISGNNKLFSCADGLSNRNYTKGWILDGDTRETSQTEQWHVPDGKWCSSYSTKTSPFCDWDYWGRTWRFGGCVKEYYRNETAIGDADYMISSQATQKGYDTDAPTTTKYNNTINASWTPVGDPGNPILANLAAVNIRRSIPVTGTISATNIREIDDSISLSICLNFSDMSNIQSQIRISSDNYKLYMSPDASAKPEYKTEVRDKQVSLTPANAVYNAIHCPIEITATRFFLLPFHTRNLISQWANARYNRIFGTTNPNANTGLTFAAMLGGAGGGTGSSGSTVAVDARVPAFLNAPDATKFASTSISTDIKNKFLDNVAKFFYERERTDVGSSNQSGYAIINKFVDVFQVGDTIFDIRYEEYRKRGLYFQQRLQALDTEYKGYKTMNLSKEDQIELETRYLQQKQALYKADDNYIWGTPQDCGVPAQYVVIDSKNQLFDISQIVIINSAGQNVALGATVHQSLRNMDYGPITTDPRTKKYYDLKTGNEHTGANLMTAASAAENDMLATKEAILTDGTYKRRYPPNTYKTLLTIPTRTGSPTTAAYSPLILDLGQTHNVSVVQIILPANVTGATADMYTVQLKKQVPAAGGSSAIVMGSSGSDTSGSIGTTDGIITFRYLGIGKDTATCPYAVYTRFKVARFYTTRTTTAGSSSPPWTVTGYSKGAEAALTFDSRYNAGIFVDTSKNGGNLQPAYYPKVTYSLNMGGSANQTPLVCSDPAHIKKVFNDYNILVNSDTFRYNTRLKTPFNNYPGEKYTATKVTHAGQNGDTCMYLWTDKVVANNVVSYKTRQGAFPYPFDTDNFNAYERVLNVSETTVIDYTSATSPAGMQALGCSTGGSGCAGIEIPEMYIKSVTLDTAGGFCPALKCSDTEVMNSLINIYNTNLSYYSQNGSGFGSGSAGMPQISKIHKAITPSATQCEFLVDTVGGATSRKVQFNNILVKGPHTIQQTTANGKALTNDKCIWVAAVSGTVTDSAGQTSVVPGVLWDNAPNMVDSTPYLMRMYNYALDVMRPISNNVTSVVNDLISMGSGQLNPAGSGIVNALIQYRTNTVAAAGDIRYFQNITDEFGNTCGKPNCKNPSVLNSLYNYYAFSSGSTSGSSNSKISQILRAGMTDDEQFCDFTFMVDNYNYQGPSVLPPTSQTSSTSGLRCRTKRTPFSCNFAVETCSYINPTPTLADIEAIPSNFVQSLGSSSTGSSGSPNSLTADITTAPLAVSGSQNLLQPPNGRRLLRSIDYIDCRSMYGGNINPVTTIASNTSLTSCSYITGPPAALVTTTRTFTKIPGSLMLVSSGWSRDTMPTGITLLTSPPSLSTVQALIPYTVVSSAQAVDNGLFEYRITTENTLDFGQTFLCAGFYLETDGSTQLSYLVPAEPARSPNAFLATSQNYVALANQFRRYWNDMFVKNRNVGNKIGIVTGYYTNRAEDSITFVANSATFGPLGKYDVQKYYSAALYKVFFRNPYAGTGTGTGTGPFIYKMSPMPTPRELNLIQQTTGSSGTFTPLSTEQAGSDAASDYEMKTPQERMNMGLFRSFKFTVTKVAQDPPIVGTSPRTRAEISRIYFYTSSSSSGSSSYLFTPLSVRNAVVSLDGAYSNYTITSGSCSTGYTGSQRQTNTGETIIDCIVNPENNASYVPPTNVACGIGYYKDDSNKCVSSGYYQEVLNPTLITTNKFVPRLRLAVGQTMTIDFNEINSVNTFSFILGSSYNRPLQWTLQGSINNIDWMNLYIQSTDFPYATTVTPGNVTSFFNPGYFLFSFSNAGVLSNTRVSTTQVAQYLQQGSTETVEGFKDPESKKLRMRTLRWKIVETQQPNAPYVHVSMLRFFTEAGLVPIETMKITNPHGSRRSAVNGPAAILSDQEGKRWIDYNKSELLITFDLAKLPSNLIHGFQFTIPSGVTDAKDYLPARWLLEGSYDGRFWIPLHKKTDKARILGGASPVYKFSQSI